jgi:hypothetical protein
MSSCARLEHHISLPRSVADARKQPTVADAVNVVLQKDGKDPSPDRLVPDVTSVDRAIPGPASSLPVRVYTPGMTPSPPTSGLQPTQRQSRATRPSWPWPEKAPEETWPSQPQWRHMLLA